MNSELRRFFGDRFVETLWLGAFVFGVFWFFLTIFFLDYQKTPPFLTHINGTIGTFVVAAFLVRNEKADTIIRLLFFPVLANCLATAIGRLYLDFDSHGSWIILFHNARSKYNCAELYRIIDFFSHFLTPIAFIHLALCNKERMKKIFAEMLSPIIPIALHIFFPVIILLCWYSGVCLSGYNPTELYLIKSATLLDAILIFLLTPLLITLPIHYGLMKKTCSEFCSNYIDTIIIVAALATCVLSFKIYKMCTLFNNTMFIVSSLIIGAALLLFFKIIQEKDKPLTINLLVLSSIFFFLVGEFHFWSVGGSEAIFLSTLKSQKFVEIHYILKQLFYIFMVFVLYAAHTFCHISNILDPLFSSFHTPRNFKISLFAGLILFVSSYYMGLFVTYDIEHTTLDPLWFFLGMLFALEIAFPVHYLLRSLKAG